MFPFITINNFLTVDNLIEIENNRRLGVWAVRDWTFINLEDFRCESCGQWSVFAGGRLMLVLAMNFLYGQPGDNRTFYAPAGISCLSCGGLTHNIGLSSYNWVLPAVARVYEMAHD